MTAPNSHSTAFTVTENLMQSSDDSNARPSLAAQEPVAWRIVSRDGHVAFRTDKSNAKSWERLVGESTITPLYDHPAPLSPLATQEPERQVQVGDAFNFWWEGEDTKGLSQACKWAAWNAWKASAARSHRATNVEAPQEVPVVESARTSERTTRKTVADPLASVNSAHQPAAASAPSSTAPLTDNEYSAVFYALDKEGLITGAWANMAWCDLPGDVRHQMRKAVDKATALSATGERQK